MGVSKVTEQKHTFASAIETMNLEELMETRGIIDEKLRQLEASISEQVAKLKNRQVLLEQAMMAKLNEMGGQTFTASSGANIHWKVNMKLSLGDAPAFWRVLRNLLDEGWPVENVFSALQKRPTTEFIKTWMENHDGKAPDGVNVFAERQLIYRKAP